MRSLAFLVVSLCVVGCGSRPSSPTSRPATWGIRNDLKALDPIRANEENTASVLALVAEPLVTVDNDGKVHPGLAASWEQTPTAVTVHLADATFSDGAPVTANDVKASYERARDAALNPVDTETYLGSIASVEARDPKTVVLKLKEPTRALIPLLSSPQLGILPARLRHVEINRPEDLIGSGPYRMTEYRPSQRTVLELNPKWRGPAPALKRIEVIPVTDPAALINRFRSGDLDLLQVASSDVANVTDSTELKAQATLLPPVKLIYLLFQPKTYPPLKDPRVRQALAMAIDRNMLATKLVRGGAAEAVRILPPAFGDQKRLLTSFDREGAKKLLAEAGYPGGRGLPPIPFLYHEANRMNPVVEYVPTALREIGVKVQGKPSTDFLGIAGRGEMPIGFSGWSAPFPDPEFVLSALLRSTSGSNFSGYKSAAYDAADAKARLSGKPEDFEAAERIALADMPILPLYTQPKLWLTSKRLKGVALSVYGGPDFLKASLQP